MPSLLNRNGIYYVTFHDAGRSPKQKRHSLKTSNKRVAVKLLARLDDAEREGAYDPWLHAPDAFLNADRPKEPKRLEEALELYFEKKRLAPSTRRSYHSRLTRWKASVGPAKPVAALSEGDVSAFVHAAPDPLTAGSRLTAIRSFLRFCRDEGMLKRDPAEKVESPPEVPRLPRAVRDEELEAVLRAIPEGKAWTRDVFRFAALTGLRCSELARLRWEDVDLDKRLLSIVEQKNGKAQTQPMSKRAAALLTGLERRREYVFASPRELKRGPRNVMAWAAQIQRAFKTGSERAGIERRITPHGLRHRYCTKLAEAGANAFVIQAAARHSDVQTSQRYVSIANEHLKAELDGVFG